MNTQDRRKSLKDEARNGIVADIRKDRGAPIMSTWTIEKFSRIGLFGRRYYFRIKSGNGEIVAQSEGVVNRTDRDTTMTRMQVNVPTAKIVELS